MTDNEIIKALETCILGDCDVCNCRCGSVGDCRDTLNKHSLDLITRQQAENDDLFYKLTGVMHSVDKWLDGDELKQDEVNRAATMREKTLQIMEKQQVEPAARRTHRQAQKAEIERLRKEVNLVSIQFQDLQERYEEAQIEIAQWKEEANKYQRLWCIAIDDVDDIETAQSEAIKEFAEELKEKLELCDTVVGSDDFGVTIEVGYEMEDVNETIDNLVKEMVDEE